MTAHLSPLTLQDKISPQHALVYTMVMLSAADADMTDKELLLIGDMVRHLPVFKGFNPENIPDVARGCMLQLTHEEGMHHVLKLIHASLPPRLYETAYAIACDTAAADGSVSPEELRLLELLRHELEIDRLHAAAIERGAKARYLVA